MKAFSAPFQRSATKICALAHICRAAHRQPKTAEFRVSGVAKFFPKCLMQHRMSEQVNSLEQRLTRELNGKKAELAALQRDIMRLERQIASARRVGAADAIAVRSSSSLRLIVEQAIINRLKQSVPPETMASQLWPVVQALGVKSHSTFRSYLRRMQKNGLIRSSARGRWRLVEDFKMSAGAVRSIYRDLASEFERD